jgi:S-adenosylmethionine:tRNA ribosyltransferase-isomerase
MIPAATWPRERPEDERLLRIDPARDHFTDARIADLPGLLAQGDLVVVNDAATVPASLRALRDGGTPFEVRLLSHDARDSTQWTAILFGRGDWRVRTEDRPPPPRLDEGERFRVAGGAAARVVAVDRVSPRLVRIAFEGSVASMWASIYEEGRPVQYAYMDAPLALWHVQSPFASRPWAVELPSAGRPLTSAVRAACEARGVPVVALTHAAGLSSSGDAALDARLPLDERYDLPAATVDAVERARATAGGRVVAVGTTVVRALEGCADAHGGALVAGEGSTDLRLGPRSRLRVVNGLLTGIHERGTSHYELVESFVDGRLLGRALEHAGRAGYVQHEFGDTVLVLPGR